MDGQERSNPSNNTTNTNGNNSSNPGGSPPNGGNPNNPLPSFFHLFRPGHANNTDNPIMNPQELLRANTIIFSEQAEYAIQRVNESVNATAEEQIQYKNEARRVISSIKSNIEYLRLLSPGHSQLPNLTARYDLLHNSFAEAANNVSPGNDPYNPPNQANVDNPPDTQNNNIPMFAILYIAQGSLQFGKHQHKLVKDKFSNLALNKKKM